MRKSRRESHQGIRSGKGGRRGRWEENEIRYLRPTASTPTPLPSPPRSYSIGCREPSLGGGKSGSRAYLYAERVAEEAMRRAKKKLRVSRFGNDQRRFDLNRTVRITWWGGHTSKVAPLSSAAQPGRTMGPVLFVLRGKSCKYEPVKPNNRKICIYIYIYIISSRDTCLANFIRKKQWSIIMMWYLYFLSIIDHIVLLFH